MPLAARLGDPTTHGPVTSPVPRNVTIAGQPAALVGDLCPMLPSAAHPLPPTFLKGSTTVYINGRPALRQGDTSTCGAQIALGVPTVQIGG